MVFKHSSELGISSTGTGQIVLYFCIDVGLGGEKAAEELKCLGKAIQDALQIFHRWCCSGIDISILKLQDGVGGGLALGLKLVRVEQPAIHLVNDLNTLEQVLISEMEDGSNEDDEQEEEVKETFYAKLDTLLSSILKEDKIILFGDFNAKAFLTEESTEKAQEDSGRH
eukprot:g38583.t1